MQYDDSEIWKRTLGLTDGPHASQIEELRQSYLKFRQNSSLLVSRITSDLPNLTQHDITHLDSLWDIASLIIGKNYPLNPLEAFILGGAILIHDSALCFEAYENGKEGLRQTNQWKDAFAEIEKDDIGYDELKAISYADFSALRELHALQSKKLLSHSWKDPENKQEFYLLENITLRKHFGDLIGTIAASHHWDIEDLTFKLPSQQNTLPIYPREWRVDPLKIACILRCADAAHIDNLRAPDFLHALLKRNGVSFNHWRAQNKLAKVDLDQSDKFGETLLFTSTTAFLENEADSWYIAHDAVSLVQKEIQSCNTLLNKKSSDLVFQIKKVANIESIEKLAEVIRVENWKPSAAQIHVGNIEHLITNLGGEMLYGKGENSLDIVIRELLQNSRDSICARRHFDVDFKGIIKIKIVNKGDADYLIIEDDGIGMSERVLTGPLLDFGTSFWTSSLVKSEFPSLRSSNFKSIGKFGIGFYSIFMISEKVSVTSKNWIDGLSNLTTLKFNNGLSLRPIITKGEIDDFHPSTSTKITIQLKKNILNESHVVAIRPNIMYRNKFDVPLNVYISAICCGLNADVFYYDKNIIEGKLIHQNIEDENLNIRNWLTDMSFSNYDDVANNTSIIDDCIDRLRFIKADNEILGLAAINVRPNMSNANVFFETNTVGGLTQNVINRDGRNFVGFINFHAKSAKREIDTNWINEKAILNWANEQLLLIEQLPLNQLEKFTASSALNHFKIDTSSIICIPVTLNHKFGWLDLNQLAMQSLHTGIAFLQGEDDNGKESNSVEYWHNIQNLPGYFLIKTFSATLYSIARDENNVPIKNNSILDLLYRKILSNGRTPKITRIKNVGVNDRNRPVHALIVECY